MRARVAAGTGLLIRSDDVTWIDSNDDIVINARDARWDAMCQPRSAPAHRASPKIMDPQQVARKRRLAGLWLTGSCALTGVTWLCLGLGLNFATIAFAYLIVVLLLSLLDSLVSSVLFSVIAIACLNYFFVEPRYTFQVNYTGDLSALAAFLVASLTVTSLVRRLRDLRDLQREQVQLLARATERDAERRRQAAHLAEAEKLSLTGSFGWSVATGEIFWSEECFRILGYDAGAKSSMEALLARVHPDDLARVREVIETAGRHKSDLDLEHRLLMPDGSVKHLRVMARPLASEQGASQLVGALMDITDRRTTEEALRYSEHRSPLSPPTVRRVCAGLPGRSRTWRKCARSSVRLWPMPAGRPTSSRACGPWRCGRCPRRRCCRWTR